MTVVDWRTLPGADIAGCYDVERETWTGRFHWDTTSNWRQVEAARAAGTLPGFVVYDGAALSGWGFYLRHRGTLQIGGITADSPIATEALVDAMLASREAAQARDVLAFVPEAACPVRSALRARGFGVRTFAYLTRSLDSPTPATGAGPLYHHGRLAATADLLSRAYPGADPSRPFAPHGTGDEWLEYTTQLVVQTGCGAWLPWASVADDDPGQPDRLIGSVLVTRIAPDTAHLAQVAVDTAWQGQGRGARLVQESLARLQRRGYTRATLLVAEDNTPALRLYARLGFARRAAFLSAWRPNPTAD